MTLADAQQQRLLERLHHAGGQPVAFAELHAGGIDFPAAVVFELQLNGYAIERVYNHERLVGVRLLHPEPRDTTDTTDTTRRTPAPPAALAAPIASHSRPTPRDHGRRPSL